MCRIRNTLAESFNMANKLASAAEYETLSITNDGKENGVGHRLSW